MRSLFLLAHGLHQCVVSLFLLLSIRFSSFLKNSSLQSLSQFVVLSFLSWITAESPTPHHAVLALIMHSFSWNIASPAESLKLLARIRLFLTALQDLQIRAIREKISDPHLLDSLVGLVYKFACDSRKISPMNCGAMLSIVGSIFPDEFDADKKVLVSIMKCGGYSRLKNGLLVLLSVSTRWPALRCGHAV